MSFILTSQSFKFNFSLRNFVILLIQKFKIRFSFLRLEQFRKIKNNDYHSAATAKCLVVKFLVTLNKYINFIIVLLLCDFIIFLNFLHIDILPLIQ